MRPNFPGRRDRPKGWPACAARVYGGTFLVFYVCTLTLIGMYIRVTHDSVNGMTIYVNCLLISSPIAFVVLEIFAITLNSGKFLAIKILLVLFKIAYIVYPLTIVVGLVLFVFEKKFGAPGLLYMIPLFLLSFLFPYIINLKRNCRWIDLSAPPEDWELPYLEKDRARLQKRW